MVGAALPILESGLSPAVPAVPNACASTALISSELMWTSALGLGDTVEAIALGVEELSDDDVVCCCVAACSNCAIFWSKDCACSAIAAAACGCATGAGFFRTSTTATRDRSSVAMLMMRSILSFIQISGTFGIAIEKRDDQA